jgi:hypothetical protein
MLNISFNELFLFPDEKALLRAVQQVTSIKWQPHTVGGLPSSTRLPFTCSSILLIASLCHSGCLYCFVNGRRTPCQPPHR